MLLLMYALTLSVLVSKLLKPESLCNIELFNVTFYRLVSSIIMTLLLVSEVWDSSRRSVKLDAVFCSRLASTATFL